MNTRIIQVARRLQSSWKFLPNRDRIIYKDRKEAFRDFWKVSGANVIFQLGLAAILYEFGFPTPDIVYDVKRLISPDFDLFCKYGDLAEYSLGFENKVRSIQREETRQSEKVMTEKSPEAKFGGII